MDAAKFFETIRQTLFHGSLTEAQVAGCTAILDAWTNHAPASDPRFVAYSLATAYWETAYKMQPVEEIGHGDGRPYGKPAGPYGLTYFGRGLVQLTWLQVYQHAETRLRLHGINVDLVRSPDLASRPDTSAAILVFGMTEGWFTGRKLADFFAGTRSDWVDARTIINGHDRAALIAGFALHFYAGLTE